MKSIILAFTLSCPQTKIINQSSEKWTEHDKLTLKGSYTRCGQKYPASPCVKVFIKREPRAHAVVCGK